MMQRYRASNNPSDKADGRQYCYAQDDGDWVLYSDHQSSLAEREQRIAELEQACRVAIHRCELCEDGQVRRYYTNAGGYDMVPCPCCGKARAALAATEGEKR